jgi:Ca-activated chloride channel family protein
MIKENLSRTLALAILLAALSTASCGGNFRFADLWLTADQQGRWYFERGEYEVAAERFEDPLWRGIAFYAAEDFESAVGQFSLVDSAEGWFNRGNALAHLKSYPDAVAAYDQALERRPDYPDAEANRDYVTLFVPWRPDSGGGESGVVGKDALPDEIVFDADQQRLNEEGIDTEMEGEGGALTDQQLAEMWLRQVETSPADFLRWKFAYQQQLGRPNEGGQP